MKIAIAGCLGRMGTTLINAVLEDRRFELVAGSERADCDDTDIQTQLAAFGYGNLTVVRNPEELAALADAVIDFTAPAATLALAEAVAAKGGIHIIGTTGFDNSQLKQLQAYGKKVRMVRAGNFSLGVAVLTHLVKQATSVLDDSYDVEIFEMHHRHKKDAPSGTALMLSEAAAAGRGVSLEDKKVLDRNGERQAGDIGFSVARGGDVVGIHSVSLAGPGEMIELRHQGFSRDIYARGALQAAWWAKNKKPGCYTINDVLSLNRAMD